MIRVSHLSMRYVTGESRVDALVDINLNIAPGERVAVTGPSGCGKTTLLQLIAGLERPTGGSIEINGESLADHDANALADLRRDHIGIVFQSFHLVPSLTALDNVALPLDIASKPDARKHARSMLEKVGLDARERHYPSQLSGGEQQRVAIARALAHRPAVILADEPTGNLDDHTGTMVGDVLFSLIRETGATLVLVTHDQELAQNCDRVLKLHDGVLMESAETAEHASHGLHR
ncbi:MAG: ABC transporter ATP-binding protein [Gammaproteobacteria bacterium]|nr:ABC transporter ATP-binding protein [Gammaproteobacteria bacterium]